ncbi:hypothetical protein CEXT_718571 [Caerostris extrusa]|uniref:Uncharacterized protein n=1 Tax=Caerostris extrusa TaxID=172846 RepID=A0AAV4USL8_CAEEX|nr:hypothetical protein CEXT_718571 [Caerostris extrusa]
MSEISNIFYENDNNSEREDFEKYDDGDDDSELQDENFVDNNELESDDAEWFGRKKKIYVKRFCAISGINCMYMNRLSDNHKALDVLKEVLNEDFSDW